MERKRYFVTAIGTGSGKTIASAILCEALRADYWKPIQSGEEEIDSQTVKTLISNRDTVIQPEQFRLRLPASPNIAAKKENKSIRLSDFILPQTSNHLIIEGAGGVLVPLNSHPEFVIDLASKFNCEVIVVINLYLGCINHSLLSFNELKQREIPVKGLIFNGEPNIEVEETILHLSKIKKLFHLNQEAFLDKNKIKEYASLFLQANY